MPDYKFDLGLYNQGVDPERDPFNAPSRRGNHPSVVREDPMFNGYDAYETREDLVGSVSPMPPPRQRKKQKPSFIAEHPVVSLLLLGLGGYALSKAMEGEKKVRKNPSSDDEEEVVQQSTGNLLPPVSYPQASPVVVVAPNYSGFLPTSQPQAAVLPQQAAPPSPKPAAKKASGARAPDQIIEKQEKRVRVTSQGRTKDGKFKKAGTAKLHKEGTGKK